MRNLKLDELFIGAWVKSIVPVPEGEPMLLSEPEYVSGIFEGGGLYLNFDGNEGDPFDCRVDEVAPVQMDEESLSGFGFVRVAKGENVWMKSIGDVRLTISLRQRHGHQECRRAAISGRFACWNEEIRYIHELQSWWRDKVLLPYGVGLKLEWKGKGKVKEELE